MSIESERDLKVKITNKLATPSCPDNYTAAFVAGTEPKETCDQLTGVKGFFSRILGIGGDKPLPPVQPAPPAQAVPGQQPVAANQKPEEKKKGLFGKIVGIFKDDKQPPPVSNPPQGGSRDTGTPH